MSSPLAASLPPRYQWIRLLGEGGMGQVVEALDQRDGRRVAVKTLRAPSDADRRRLEAEVRTLARLQHQNIVRFLDAGDSGAEIYLAMELLEGVPLDRLLQPGPPGAKVIRWLLEAALQICEALLYCHSRGVIHRDLKPSNVLALHQGETTGTSLESRLRGLISAPTVEVKVIDFGLASDLARLQSSRDAAAGTPVYMPPEQIRGEATESSDLYALGALLHHLITGSPPHAGLTQILAARSPPRPAHTLNPDCPVDLSNLLQRLLAPEPSERPSSAAETREALLQILHAGRESPRISDRLLPAVFVGRAAELDSLRRLLSDAASGRGGCVFLEGYRGSGKSWLLRESGIVAEALADHGLAPFRIAFASGISGLGALSNLLEDLAAAPGAKHSSCAALQKAIDEWRSTIGPPSDSQLAPGTPRGAPGADDGTGAMAKILRDRRVSAALQVLRAASERPLFLEIEDAQHAGEMELEILSQFSRWARGRSIALVVAFRTEALNDANALKRWVQELDGGTALRRISLGELSDGEAAALLARRLYPEGKVAPEVVAALTARAEGNPLALSRWLEALWQRGQLRRIEGEWRLAVDAHEGDASAETIWTPILGTLSSSDRALLAAASVLGSPADAETLRRVAGLEDGQDERGIAQALRELAARGLLSEDREELRPSPDLETGSPGAAVLARLLGEKELRAFHARAASSLAKSSGALDGSGSLRVARHLEAAGRNEEAARQYVSAARHLAGSFLNTLAIEAYRRALELTQAPELPGEIEEGLGDLHSRLGDHATALKYFHGAIAKRGKSSSVLDKIGRVLHRKGELTEALAVFTERLESAGSDDAARALALLRLGGVLLDRGQAAEARERLEESLALYTRLGDVRQSARVQFSLGVAEKQQNRPELAATRFEEALRSAETSGSLLEAATTLNNLGNLHRAMGDDQRALECLRRSMSARESMGDRQGIAIVLNNIARVHLVRGELAAARPATEEALRIFEEVGDVRGVLIARSNLGETLLQLGILGEARSLLTRVTADAERHKVPRILEAALCTLGALEQDSGDHMLAREHVRRALATIPEEKPGELRAAALSLFASICLRLNDWEGAADSLREASFIADELGLRGKLGLFHVVEARFHLERGDVEAALAAGKPHLASQGGLDRLHWGLLHVEAGKCYRELGPDWADRTERELTKAIRVFEAMPSPIHSAGARIELGIYWRLVGEEAVAAELFQSASEALNRSGAHRRIQELTQLKEQRT